MDVNKKKIIILDLAVIAGTEYGGEFRIDTAITEKIKACGSPRIAIINDREDNLPLVKAVEIYLFTSCHVAVSTHHSEDVIEEVIKSLPHKIQKRDLMLKVGGNPLEGVEYITREDYVNTDTY